MILLHIYVSVVVYAYIKTISTLQILMAFNILYSDDVPFILFLFYFR